MSVYDSEKNLSSVKYVAAAMTLRKTTMRNIKKFPKSYRHIITDKMLDLANDVYINCNRANAVYVCKAMTEGDMELRHRYLAIAESDVKALLSEITFCHELIKDGNNFYKNKADYGKKFNLWTGDANEALKLIRGVIKSDKRRWSEWHGGDGEKPDP